MPRMCLGEAIYRNTSLVMTTPLYLDLHEQLSLILPLIRVYCYLLLWYCYNLYHLDHVISHLEPASEGATSTPSP
jgi:hypothetical protein